MSEQRTQPTCQCGLLYSRANGSGISPFVYGISQLSVSTNLFEQLKSEFLTRCLMTKVLMRKTSKKLNSG